MAILPEGAQVLLLVLTGSRWPEGDEGGLRELGKAWTDWAEALDTVLDKAAAASGKTASGLHSGNTADGFRDTTAKEFKSDDAPLVQLSKAARQLASLCNNTATQVEYAKRSIIAGLIALAASFLASYAAGPFALLIQQAILTVAKLIVSQFLRWLFTKVMMFLAQLAIEITIEVLLGVLSEVAVQASQIIEGHRDGFDNDAIANAARSGVLSGAGSVVVGKALGKVGDVVKNSPLGKAASKTVNQVVENKLGKAAAENLGKAAKGTGEVLEEAISEGAGELFASAVEYAIDPENNPFNPFAGSAGAIGGGAMTLGRKGASAVHRRFTGGNGDQNTAPGSTGTGGSATTPTSTPANAQATAPADTPTTTPANAQATTPADTSADTPANAQANTSANTQPTAPANTQATTSANAQPTTSANTQATTPASGTSRAQAATPASVQTSSPAAPASAPAASAPATVSPSTSAPAAATAAPGAAASGSSPANQTPGHAPGSQSSTANGTAPAASTSMSHTSAAANAGSQTASGQSANSPGTAVKAPAAPAGGIASPSTAAPTSSAAPMSTTTSSASGTPTTEAPGATARATSTAPPAATTSSTAPATTSAPQGSPSDTSGSGTRHPATSVTRSPAAPSTGALATSSGQPTPSGPTNEDPVRVDTDSRDQRSTTDSSVGVTGAVLIPTPPPMPPPAVRRPSWPDVRTPFDTVRSQDDPETQSDEYGSDDNDSVVTISPAMLRPDPAVLPSAPAPVSQPARPGVPAASWIDKPVDDPAWRRSPAETADWFEPDNPLHSSEWEHLRASVAPATIDTEFTQVQRGSTVKDIKATRGLVRFDIRRIHVRPGKWVKEFTVRIELNPGWYAPAEVDRVKAEAIRGVNRVFNQGNRLPSKDQLHVRLEFTDDPDAAHAMVVLAPAGYRSDQLTWQVDATGPILAHEIGHFLGLNDHYFDENTIFQNHEPGARRKDGTEIGHRVFHGPGVMTGSGVRAVARLVPRDAWTLEQVLASQWHDKVPQPSPPAPSGPSMFERAAAGDIFALIQLARDGHVASLDALTEQAGRGSPLAQAGLLDIASQGDAHAAAALARVGINSSHPMLDGLTPVEWLAERAYRPEMYTDNELQHSEHHDLLVELADKDDFRPALHQLLLRGDSRAFSVIADKQDARWLTELALRHDTAMWELYQRDGLPAVLELLDWHDSPVAREVLRTLAAKDDADALDALDALASRADIESLGLLVQSNYSVPAARALAELAVSNNNDALDMVFRKLPVHALRLGLHVDQLGSGQLADTVYLGALHQKATGTDAAAREARDVLTMLAARTRLPSPFPPPPTTPLPPPPVTSTSTPRPSAPPSTVRDTPVRPASPEAAAERQPSTPDEIQAGLPFYLKENRASGLSKQTGPLVSDDVDRTIKDVFGPTAKVDGIDMLPDMIRNGILDFVGQGRTFAVTVDGKPDELHVVTELDWSGATEDVDAKPEPLDTEAKNKTENKQKTENDTTGGLPVNLNVTAVPPLVVALAAELPANPTIGTTREVTQQNRVQYKISRAGTTDVTVPVRIVLTRRGSADGTATGGSASGTVPLRVPTGLGATPGPATGEAHPSAFTLEAIFVNKEAFGTGETATTPALFDTIAAALPHRVTKIGTSGRAVLHDFLSDSVLKTNHAKMVAANKENKQQRAARSEALLGKGDGGRWDIFPARQAVETWLVPKKIQELAHEGVQDSSVDFTSTLVTRTENKDTLTNKRQLVVSGGAGVLAGVGPVKGGVVINASGTVGSEHTQEHNHVSVGTQKVTVAGPMRRLLATYDLHYRGPGGETQTVEDAVSAVLWTPPTTTAPQPDAPRSHYAPAHLEAGVAIGQDVQVEGLTNSDEIYDVVYQALRKVAARRWYHPSRKEFLNQFGDTQLAIDIFTWASKVLRGDVDAEFTATLSKGITPSRAQNLERGDTLRSTLSDQHLRMLADRMLTVGLRFPLVKKSTLFDYTTTLVLHGTLTNIQDGDLLAGDKITRTDKRKTRSGTAQANTRSLAVSASATGRVISAVTGTFTLKHTWTATAGSQIGSENEGAVHQTHGDHLDVDGTPGSQPQREFFADLTVTATQYSFARLHTEARRVLPGLRRELRIPRTEARQLEPVTTRLRMLVPEILVDAGGTSLSKDKVDLGGDKPRSIADLAPTSRTLDTIRVSASTVSENLLAAALTTVHQVTGDPAMNAPGGVIATRLAGLLAPDALNTNPRLFTKPITARGLHYGRRTADTVAAVGIKLVPSGVEVLDLTEYQKHKISSRSTTKVSNSRGTENAGSHGTVTANFGPTVSWTRGGVSGTPASAGGSLTPWTNARGKTDKLETKVVEKKTLAKEAEQRHLVKLSVDAIVVAEARFRSNLVNRYQLGTPAPAAVDSETIRLPDSMLAWVTDEELAEIREVVAARDAQVARSSNQEAAPPVPTGQPTEPVEPRIAPPSSTTVGEKPSVGVGMATTPIDLTELLPKLREKVVDGLTRTAESQLRLSTLRTFASRPSRFFENPAQLSASWRREKAAKLGADAASRLLPQSMVDTTHDNWGAVTEFLSNVDRSMTDALNGNVLKPLRLEDRFTGRTYTLWVEGTLVSPLTLTGISHAGEISTEGRVVVSRIQEKVVKLTSLVGQLGFRGGGKQAGPAPAADRGPASGGAATGADFTANINVSSKTSTTKREPERRLGATAAGPLAVYRGRMKFAVWLERHGEVVGKSTATNDNKVTAYRDVSIQRMVGDTLPEPGDEKYGRTQQRPNFPENPDVQASPSQLHEWHGSPDHVSRDQLGVYFHPEHYFGDVSKLVDAAAETLTRAGAKVTGQAERMLAATITASLVKGAVPAMMEDHGFPVPLPLPLSVLSVLGLSTHHELDLHLRLSNPRFASVSAGVTLTEKTKDLLERKEKLVSGNEAAINAIAPAVTAGLDQAPGRTQNFGGFTITSTNDIPLTRTNPARSLIREAKDTDHKKTELAKADDKADSDNLTQVLLFDAEFMFVARPVGRSTEGTTVSTVEVRSGYGIRLLDGKAAELVGSLPDELKDAAKDLAAKGTQWRTSEATRKAKETAQTVTPEDVAKAKAAEQAWLESERALDELHRRHQVPGGGPQPLRLDFEPGFSSLDLDFATYQSDPATDEAVETVELVDMADVRHSSRAGTSDRSDVEVEPAEFGRTAEVVDQWRADAGMVDLLPPPSAAAEPVPQQPPRNWGVRPRSTWPPDPWPEFGLVPVQVTSTIPPHRNLRRTPHGPGIV
nr:hypothetical protein [Kibdelosporangium sp. MJ126-NF4]CEL16304.1 predicted periplasmic solute-binding protein [Kibdelosporangium sp. MJ126-NF4]CTQ94228.1 predicted periplasmic solute-binding protein [Kibdelosporangium sp. MJ126-NF4]